MSQPLRSAWVSCPICGEDDMRRTEDAEGHALISCVNHHCASNGGTMRDALPAASGFVLKPMASAPRQSVCLLLDERIDDAGQGQAWVLAAWRPARAGELAGWYCEASGRSCAPLGWVLATAQLPTA